MLPVTCLPLSCQGHKEAPNTSHRQRRLAQLRWAQSRKRLTSPASHFAGMMSTCCFCSSQEKARSSGHFKVLGWLHGDLSNVTFLYGFGNSGHCALIYSAISRLSLSPISLGAPGGRSSLPFSLDFMNCASPITLGAVCRQGLCLSH